MTQPSQRKELSELRGSELETYAQEVKAIIAGLSELDPDQLDTKQQAEREEGLQDAYSIGSAIAFEQLTRGIQQLRDVLRKMGDRAKSQGQGQPSGREGKEGQV